MDGLFNHYLPATFHLQWPVFENYHLFTLEDAIAFLEEKRKIKLTDPEWDHLSEILDPGDSFPPSEIFQHLLMIVPTSETIRTTIDPFSGFFNPEEPLLSLQTLAGKKIGWDSEKDFLRWVKKYGLLFNRPHLTDSPNDILGIIDYTTDGALQSLLTLEHWIYEKFGLNLTAQYHLLYRAKELKFIYQLAQLLTEASSDGSPVVLPSFYGFADRGTANSATVGQIRELIHEHFRYHLQFCRVSLSVIPVPKYREERDSPELSEETLPVLKLEPPDLFSALNLLFAKLILPNPNVGVCEHCGTAFQKGRRWGKYCSKTCGTSYRKEKTRKKSAQ